MANKDTISQKIELTGEAQYSATLKSVNRNLRTLKSELKAETKELGNNATAQQKAEVQAKNLKKQIAEQEKAVQACRDALEEAKEKYGDNEQVVSTYEVKLNNARAALADMKNQLDSVGGSLQQNATDLEAVKTAANTGITATESFANALEKVGTVGETVSGTIESIFSGIVGTVRDTVVELWSMIAETSAKANRWTDIAALWGTDAQTIQQWSGSIHAAGKDLGDLQAMVSRIVLGGKEKQITELLGISDVNYTDQWEYATKVIGQLYNKVQAGEDITPITEAIFGEKKSTTILDLVNAWGDIVGGLETFNGDIGGFGMTSEGLEMFNQISLQISEIEAKWEGLKDRFLEGFGTTTLTLQAHVIGGLDALADYMNAESDEERQAALDKLTEEVEGFARDAAAAIEAGIEALSQIGSNLKESDNPYVAAVGNIFEGVANTLEWIVNNQEDVVNALKAIFGMWLIAKIAAIAGKLSSVVASIEVIRAFTAGNAAKTAAKTAAETTAGTGMFARVMTSTAAKITAGAGTFLTTLLDPDLYKHTGGVLGNDTGNDAHIDKENKVTEIAMKEAIELGYEKGSNPDDYLEWLNTKNPYEVSKGVAIEEERNDNDWENPLNGITEEQRNAAETFWDFWKNWDKEDDDAFDEAYDAYAEAFEGSDGLFDAMEELMDHLYQTSDNPSDIGDLPASFWEELTEGESLTKNDVAAFNKVPGDMAAAVESAITSGLSGITVNIDGQAAGNILLPYINQGMAVVMR